METGAKPDKDAKPRVDAKLGVEKMKSFEEQLTELEQVVEQLERGELSLEDSVTLFERGVTLSDACKSQLASAESRIQVLVNPRERGPVRVEELMVGDEEDDGGKEDDEEVDEE